MKSSSSSHEPQQLSVMESTEQLFCPAQGVQLQTANGILLFELDLWWSCDIPCLHLMDLMMLDAKGRSKTHCLRKCASQSAPRPIGHSSCYQMNRVEHVVRAEQLLRRTCFSNLWCCTAFSCQFYKVTSINFAKRSRRRSTYRFMP